MISTLYAVKSAEDVNKFISLKADKDKKAYRCEQRQGNVFILTDDKGNRLYEGHIETFPFRLICDQSNYNELGYGIWNYRITDFTDIKTWFESRYTLYEIHKAGKFYVLVYDKKIKVITEDLKALVDSMGSRFLEEDKAGFQACHREHMTGHEVKEFNSVINIIKEKAFGYENLLSETKTDYKKRAVVAVKSYDDVQTVQAWMESVGLDDLISITEIPAEPHWKKYKMSIKLKDREKTFWRGYCLYEGINKLRKYFDNKEIFSTVSFIELAFED